MGGLSTRPSAVVRKHSRLMETALRYVSVLELIKSAAAQKLRAQFYATMTQAQANVDGASTAGVELLRLKRASDHANSAFKALVRGLVGGIELTDSKLFAKIPPLASFSKLDPDGYGTALGAELKKSGGKLGDELSKLLGAAMERRVADVTAFARAGEEQTPVQQGKAANAQLQQLILAADQLIQETVPPRSPLYAKLEAPKEKRSSPKPDKQAGQKRQAASSSASTSAAARKQSAPTQNAPSSSASTPPGGAAGTQAPPEVVVTAPIVVPATGATGPQMVNGLAHS